MPFNDQTAINLAQWASGKAPSAATPQSAKTGQPATPGVGQPASLSPKQGAAFNAANQHFHDSHMQAAPPDQGQGAGVHKGWSPQARIAAAKARNAQTLPYGGDPTQAPDYTEPKQKGGK